MPPRQQPGHFLQVAIERASISHIAFECVEKNSIAREEDSWYRDALRAEGSLIDSHALIDAHRPVSGHDALLHTDMELQLSRGHRLAIMPFPMIQVRKRHSRAIAPDCGHSR